MDNAPGTILGREPAMVLALIQASGRESRERWLTRPPQGADGPAISVLIPCFNEGPLLGETLSAA